MTEPDNPIHYEIAHEEIARLTKRFIQEMKYVHAGKNYEYFLIIVHGKVLKRQDPSDLFDDWLKEVRDIELS